MFPFVRCQLRLRPGRCGVGGTNVPLAPATVAEPGRQWPCAQARVRRRAPRGPDGDSPRNGQPCWRRSRGSLRDRSRPRPGRGLRLLAHVVVLALPSPPGPRDVGSTTSTLTDSPGQGTWEHECGGTVTSKRPEFRALAKRMSLPRRLRRRPSPSDSRHPLLHKQPCLHDELHLRRHPNPGCEKP